MRVSCSLAVLAAAFVFAAPSHGQSCTGLCLQQVVCPAGQTTSISGVVYAPNGLDPLPNVLVYVPNAPVDAFTPGVSCPVVGATPSGSPLTGATTGTDGSFTIPNMPVGNNIPLVIVSGRWRRQITVNVGNSCGDNPVTGARMPRNQSEGDIPKIAVVTGSADAVECVLRKVGIDDTEFTVAAGGGRVNLYTGAGNPGAVLSSGTASEASLMGASGSLNQYDVLMLPCEGGSYTKPSAELANLISFANSGGRVYSSHYAYTWMYKNPPFNTVANWAVDQGLLADGTATVDTTFAAGKTLADWLQLVGATTNKGQMAISTLRHDLNGVTSASQSWLRLNDTAHGNPVMQFVFDAPVGATNAQCGRVLFNEYHVENPSTSTRTPAFPTECGTGTTMTPQEKLLEYSLFELTADGAAATLTPTSADFGDEAVGFSTAAKSFVWTNNSTFAASPNLLNASGDFTVSSNNCATVAAGASCTISVIFSPSALGARTGTLSVGSGGTTLTAALTGNGTPGLTLGPGSLNFGNVDVTASQSLPVTLTNNAPGALPLPPLTTTGDYSVSTTCAANVPASSTCTITVTFSPTVNGTRAGTLNMVSSGLTSTVALTGNGLDFSVALSPTSGTLIAGHGTSTTLTVTALSGFNASLQITCSTNAPGSACTPVSPYIAGSGSDGINLVTTPQYGVIGYGGLPARGVLLVFGVASGLLLLRRGSRRSLAAAGGLMVLALTASLGLGGCSGQLPTSTTNYTKPGTYSYTVTATDGVIRHSATYSLTVTAN